MRRFEQFKLIKRIIFSGTSRDAAVQGLQFPLSATEAELLWKLGQNFRSDDLNSGDAFRNAASKLQAFVKSQAFQNSGSHCCWIVQCESVIVLFAYVRLHRRLTQELNVIVLDQSLTASNNNFSLPFPEVDIVAKTTCISNLACVKRVRFGLVAALWLRDM